MLDVKYLSQYPIDQDLLRYGNKQTTQTQLDYQRFLNLEAHRTKWLLQAAKYEQLALDNPESIGAVHYKYLALTMEEVVRCMAAPNQALTQLTPHAHRYWRVFNWRKAIDPATAARNAKEYATAGLIGSLAAYTYIKPDLDWTGTPLATIQQLITVFWAELGIDAATTLPNARLTTLLANLDFDWSYIDLCKPGLALLTKTSNDLKLNLIDESVLKALPARLLLGDLPDQFISAWARLQAECNSNPIKAAEYQFQPYSYQVPFALIQAGLVVGHGGGWALVMQAIYIEALYKIVQLLPNDLNQTQTQYITDAAQILNRVELARLFALAADAQTVLSIFKTSDIALTKAQEALEAAVQWLATTNQLTLPIAAPYRLPLMLRAIQD